MSKYRKAIAAFLTPLLALPISAWLIDTSLVDWQLIATAVVTGIAAAYTVWQTPNTTV